MPWNLKANERLVIQKLNDLGPRSKSNTIRHAFVLWADDALTDDDYSSKTEPERLFGGMASRSMFEAFAAAYQEYAKKEERKFTGDVSHLVIGTSKFTFLVLFDVDDDKAVAHCLVGVADTDDLMYSKAVKALRSTAEYLNSL